MAANSTRREKINWLLERQSEWEGFPAESKDMTVAHRKLARSLFAEMQEDGLISDRTNFHDANIFSMIQAARRQRRESGQEAKQGDGV